MIELHRLNGEPFWLNHRIIEIIEHKPDTMILLNNEKRYVVKESAQEISNLIINFNRKIYINMDRVR